MRPYFKPVLLTTSLFLILLFIVAKSPVRAGAAHFPTVEEVQQMIANALSPIQSSIQGISNRVSNLETTVTSIPSEIAGIQATLTPIPGQIAALQNATGKSLHVLDANNQDLGLYMWDDDNLTTYVFITSLNRRVIIQDFQILRSVLFFSTPDCSGTPYVQVNPNQLNDVYSVAPGKYFVASINGRTGLNAQSRQAWISNTLSCGSYVAGVGGVVQVTSVNLPFSE